MFKLFRFFRKYLKIIPFIFILIAVQAVASLMLPDYMSRIISEGIKSPAYETDGQGNNIKAVISPFNVPAQYAAMLTVKKYARNKPVGLFRDGNGVAYLADDQGNPVMPDGEGNISAAILYEKDGQGNLIKDADTGEYIPKYIYTDEQGATVADSYILSDNGIARPQGIYMHTDNVPVIAPAVTGVLIYAFDEQPAPLALDAYGNAVFEGFYMREGGLPYFIKMGDSDMPVLKFARKNGEYGALLTDGGGNAMLKQVSYIPVIIRYGLIMLGITFLISACAITANFLSSNVSLKTGRDIRSSLYSKISRFSVLDAGRIGTSSLITRTTNDVTQVQTVFFMMFRMVIMPPIMFVGGIIMALNKNAQMTLVLAVSIPVILALVFVVGRFVIPLFKSMQKKIDALTLVARENLTGVRVIRAFNREGSEDERFARANKDVTDTAVKANRIMSVLFPAVSLVMGLTTLAIVAVAVIRTKNNIMGTSLADFANMMAVSQYIMQIMMSILFIMMIFVMFPRASASAARINEILATEPVIKECENPVTVSGEGVVFEDVSFSFEGSEMSVLSDINFTANKGETVAVIGSTGSGKSTLVNLIARLFDPTKGRILIGGVDIKQYSLKELREKISFVPQKSLLFSGTIADNLRFGDSGADEEKMMKALKTAQAEEFVSRLEKGIDSPVEQGGVNFSGGQKQRLSIARAIIKNADIYIFDDSFSALDFRTDSNLRRALKKELRDKTVIIVAQRIGTVMNADRIIVIDEGRIVCQGTHKQLLKDCAVYKEIALSQLAEEELK